MMIATLVQCKQNVLLINVDSVLFRYCVKTMAQQFLGGSHILR